MVARPPALPLLVAGYSFGAVTTLEHTTGAVERTRDGRGGGEPAAVLLIAPPVTHYQGRGWTLGAIHTVVIYGERDGLTPQALLEEQAASWGPNVRCVRIAGVGHDLGSFGAPRALESALDTAVAAEESARADLAIAKANVENAKATLSQREATLDSARIDLDRTYIRSPIDGVVIDKIVEVGQTVAASLQAPKLFTIAQDLNHVQIEAQVDEADIGQVTRDNQVSFRVDAYPEATFEGVVEQIRLAPVALQNVVTYTVVIAADNPLGRLLPGMTANVDIVTGEHANVVTVPNDALRFQPRGPAEALVSDNSVTGATQTTAGAGDRTGRLLDRLRVDLALTPEEIDKVRAGVEAEFAALRGAAPQGIGGSQEDAREQARLRVAKVLRAVLTPERYKKYEELQRSRPTNPRSGTIWVYESGRLVPHHLRLGLSDANVTEVIDGIQPGAHVVLRAREIAP